MALVLSMFESGDRVKAMGWWSMVGAGGPVLGVADRRIHHPEHRMARDVPPRDGARSDRPGARGRGPARARRRPAAHARAGTAALDMVGAVLVVVSVGSLLFGLNRAPVVGFSGRLVIGAFCLSAVAGVVARHGGAPRRGPARSVPLSAERNFALPLGAQALRQLRLHGRLLPHSSSCSSRCTDTASRRPACSSSRGPCRSHSSRRSPGT